MDLFAFVVDSKNARRYYFSEDMFSEDMFSKMMEELICSSADKKN